MSPHVMLLCELEQALNKGAGIQSADWSFERFWPVVGCICGITLSEDGGN